MTKYKTIIILEDNIRKNLCDFGIGEKILVATSKAQIMKYILKICKLNFSKNFLKNLFCQTLLRE